MFSQSKRDQFEIPTTGGAGQATIIARGVRVDGDFTSQSDVHIEGDVEGHVSTTGTLTIGAEAHLKADVKANAASIAGAVDGTLTIIERLDLKSTARILGDVTCMTASIEPGAVLNGKISIGSPPSPGASGQGNGGGAKERKG